MQRIAFSICSFHAFKHSFSVHREFAIVGGHSQNVALKKNKLDASKMKLFNRISIKITMVGSMIMLLSVIT